MGHDELTTYATVTDSEHRPTLVCWGSRHTARAEVCMGCSDPDNGVWVPVTFCQRAKAQMTDDTCSSYADIYGVIRPED